MSNGILNIVIDERKQLSNLNETALMQASQKFVAGQHPSSSVFKDYILSSEVFYVDITH
ncbi:hypothetical protein [Vampirovibrio sp.]|uniref:hypothetical protein n=1 Tax=Vampirovibrio sp. TaxID=2717857 RepID=UPI0035933B38